MDPPGSTVNRHEESGRGANQRCGWKRTVYSFEQGRVYEHDHEHHAADPQCPRPEEQQARQELKTAEHHEHLVLRHGLDCVMQGLRALDERHEDDRKVQRDKRPTKSLVRHDDLAANLLVQTAEDPGQVICM
jgi:hypothetical protein